MYFDLLIFSLIEQPGVPNFTIEYLSVINSVKITRFSSVGNYDLSHYTVQLFVNNAETSSIDVSFGTTEIILPVPSNIDIYAKITATSKCNQTSAEVETNTIFSGGEHENKFPFRSHIS